MIYVLSIAIDMAVADDGDLVAKVTLDPEKEEPPELRNAETVPNKANRKGT